MRLTTIEHNKALGRLQRLIEHTNQRTDIQEGRKKRERENLGLKTMKVRTVIEEQPITSLLETV